MALTLREALPSKDFFGRFGEGAQECKMEMVTIWYYYNPAVQILHQEMGLGSGTFVGFQNGGDGQVFGRNGRE